MARAHAAAARWDRAWDIVWRKVVSGLLLVVFALDVDLVMAAAAPPRGMCS